MKRSSEEHFAEYSRDGYTIFKGYMPPERLRAVRTAADPEFARRFDEHPERARTSIANILGHDPLSTLLTEHIINAHVLDFAERVMGPFVQLDSFEITGFPSRPANERNQVAQWHRDAFNYSDMWGTHPASEHFKPHHYTAPTACNCLTYLQNMDEESGALRIVPGSHLDFSYIKEEDREQPHPRELLVQLEAGDMVFTHNEILHAGSINTKEEIRYFISAYFQRIGLPHRDRFNYPQIEAICANARARNDRRTLRLFGIDPLFAEREQAAWQKMIEEDRAAMDTWSP
jgi:ectoine hydroxylase-related dioxygenase (phytanoyl-CoA dioxygenase family)